MSESFRGLRTSLLLSRGGRSANSILVTSAHAGEGKTTIAVNLAISLAQLGRRVLLIDADMRRPSVQKYFPQNAIAFERLSGRAGKLARNGISNGRQRTVRPAFRAASRKPRRIAFLRRDASADS